MEDEPAAESRSPRRAKRSKGERAEREREHRADDDPDTLDQVVTLNVGGRRYQTLLRTLQRVPDSLLATMFSGRWVLRLPVDEKGRYFIDRNPDMFKYILEFLRTHELPRFRDEADTDSFYRELEYFGLGTRPGVAVAHLKYLDIMDENGVFYYLGTAGATQPWRNPVVAGLVRVMQSSAFGVPSALADRDTSLHTLQSRFSSLGHQWLELHFPQHQLQLERYMLYCTVNGSQPTEPFLREWDVLASNDGFHWDVIDEKVDDTLRHDHPAHCFACASPGCQHYYSHFRFMVKRNESNRPHYSFTEMELYGKLRRLL